MSKSSCPYHENDKWCKISNFLSNTSKVTGETDNKIYDLWLHRLGQIRDYEEKNNLFRYYLPRMTFDYFEGESDEFDKNVILPVSCLGDYKPTRRLGGGVSSDVYDACKDTDCKYVIRIQQIDMPFAFYGYEGGFLTVFVDEFLSEAALTKLMGELGIGPTVHDIKVCKADNFFKKYDRLSKGWLGLVVMDKLDIILKDLKSAIPDIDLNIITNILIKKAKKMAIEAKINHDDISLDNIMIRLSPLDAFFIDFGVTSKLNNTDEIMTAIDNMTRKIKSIMSNL